MKFKVIIVTVALFLGLLSLAPLVDARVRVRGYSNKNGTYVMPHYRTSPNRTKLDNWSTKGNVNPYNNKRGYSGY